MRYLPILAVLSCFSTLIAENEFQVSTSPVDNRTKVVGKRTGLKGRTGMANHKNTSMNPNSSTGAVG